MLWTLYNRATEAMREDGILRDPKAVEIYGNIEYDYERSFGKASPVHALRSLAFDREVIRFLEKYSNGTIVNLGEGLETQRFRIPSPQALWLSVDVPEAVQTREAFIQPDAQHVHLPLSALDRAWFDAVPGDRPVFVTAQGLLMYFSEADVRSLLQDVCQKFDNCCLMFDTIPRWFSQKTTSPAGYSLTGNYVAPKMPWGIDRGEIRPTLTEWLGDSATIEDMGYPRLTRDLGWLMFALASRLPILKDRIPTIVKVRPQR
ncbi:MAG: class I SAM-dependent methyltransferase [Geitlerinemataceae cyanobacterium]